MSTEPPPLRRNRDFLLLWSGSAVSSLGSNASSVAYPLLVLSLTGSTADAGLAGFVAMLPHLLFQLPAGALVDRWDRKRLMVRCDALCALALGSLVVALLMGRLTLAHVLVVGFVEGTLSLCGRLADSAAVPHVVARSQLAQALSHNEARTRGAAMLGQPLGGVLFGMGRAVPFLLDALTYVVSLVAVLFVRKDLQAAREPVQRGGWAELAEGAVWLWRQPFLRMTTLLIAGSNLLFRALFLVVIVVAADQGATPAEVGLMFGMAAVGGLLGALAAPAIERVLSMRAVVIGANWAWCLLAPLMLTVHDPLMLGVVYALMCFVGPVWNVVVSAHQLAVTPDRIRGRVNGAVGTLAYGAIPLGSLAGGYLLTWVGSTATVWALAGWMLLLSVTATLSPAVRSSAALGETPARL